MHSLSLLDELFGLEELPQIKDLKQFFGEEQSVV